MDNEEVKKQLSYLRGLQGYLSESSANQKDFSRIIDIYKNPIHRILKINCYPLLKTFPNNELVCLELEKEFNNKDYELQLISLKLAYCLPINNLMQIVKSYDTAFYQIIEQSAEFHYERLCAVNSILELLLTKETEVDSIDMPKQTITNIYLRIADNCFNNNRDISANCIICLTQFLQNKLQNPNNLTYVNYDKQQIKQYLLIRIQILYEKICSYEIRIRSKMLLLLSDILIDAPKELQQQQSLQQNPQMYTLQTINFNNKILKDSLYDILQYNFEIDLIIQISTFILSVTQQCQKYQYFNTSQIIWQLFDNIDKYIQKVNYKKELNQILFQILQFNLDINTNIAISIRIIEISFLIQNQLTRLLFMLYCFSNLIKNSIELIYQKKNSAILGLYNQPWFLTKIKDEPEELISCLIIAAIHQEKNKQILLEIMDICNGCIWDGCNIEAILMYLLLIEECTNVIPYDEIRLDDLINRMNTNQISFIQKVQTLIIITKKFKENNLKWELDYINILAEFRTFMIQPIQTQICQINLLQNVYKVLYYLSINFHTQQNQIRAQILELLSDYNDNLQQRKNDTLAEQLCEFNRNFVKSLQYKEILQQDQLQIKISNQIDSTNQNLQNMTTYQIAYNIFNKQQYQSDQNILIMNLRSLQVAQKNIFTELQFNSKLITGVSDFIQVYCSHTLDLQKSCICLAIRVINNCPFKLDNLGIKILLDRNAYIQNNYKSIEELPSYQEHQLFYVVKVNPKHSMHFAFDLLLPDIKNEACQSFTIRTQNYRISMLEFLIPNTFLYLSQNCFQYIAYDTTITKKCYLEGNYLQLYKKLLEQPFATVILDDTNQVFINSQKSNLNLDLIAQNVSPIINIGLLSYLINGQNLAILISNVSTQSNSTEVHLEIKSEKSCIESFQSEIDKFLFEWHALNDLLIMKKYTSNQQLRRSNGPSGRYRVFKHTEIDRANLFEGLPYVQFDAFIRRDRTMQHVVVRDLLKIIMEKCNQLKNLLLDKFRLKRIFLLMDLMEQPKKKGVFNQRLEDTIVLIDQIGSIILQEFKKNPEQIGLKPSPIVSNEPEYIEQQQEEKIYEKNVDLFNEMLQYLRDRIELYMLMMRQAGHKILDDQQCMSFLKDVTALRYNLLQLSEDIRVLDANSEENLKLIKLTLQKFDTIRRVDKLSPIKNTEEQRIEDKKLEEKRKKIEYIEKNLIGKTLQNSDDQAESEVQKKRALRLNELLQQKFNFNKSSIITRESKLILNQDKLEQEKVLLLESSQKASKIKHDLVDNRKRLALEKLKDPTKDPQLRSALEIMTRVLNINIQDQFQE